MDTFETTILSNLVSLRKAAGLSQKQVEENLQLRANTLYDFEKGRLKLPVVLAAQLMKLYHTDLNQLLVAADFENSVSDPGQLPDSAQHPQAQSLMSLGVISGGTHPLSSVIAQDPVIVAEVGVGQLGKKPLMELLLDQLTDVQRRHFVLDLYRYINSLISSDGEIRQSELSLRDKLVAQAQIELTEAETKSIARAFQTPFFGKSMSKSLPRESFKHFIIWTLHLVGHIDGKTHFRTSEYIQAVAEHIHLPVSSLRYIEDQVKLAYRENS